MMCGQDAVSVNAEGPNARPRLRGFPCWFAVRSMAAVFTDDTTADGLGSDVQRRSKLVRFTRCR
jgi:hypothetical protein